MKLLVTGGAGYIGSIMTKQLLDTGHDVVVLDDLSHGHKDAVDKRAELVVGSIGNKPLVRSIFQKDTIEGVFHFAGVISVAESVKDPKKYHRINTEYAKGLLETMLESNVTRIIFSSTAAVYGNPNIIPIPETHPKEPESPYGVSKLKVEELLHKYDKNDHLRYVALRYFNASGATLDGVLGERHKNESHIIPLAIKALLSNGSFTLYGNDYDTPDGTCIRDYIHIEDLCSAHLQALEFLVRENKSNIFNVGTGTGYSNKQVIQEVERVSGKDLVVNLAKRRAGDPAQLVADSTKIRDMLSWEPKYSSLHQIIQTAWNFHSETKNV